jgi:predicted phage tail protein
MLRKIKLYGQLAKFVGVKVLEADVASAAEAVRFLIANFPELEKHMSDQYYRVSVGQYDISLDELHDPAGQQEIKIIPVIGGAGGSVGSILAGVALIAFAIAFAPVGAGFLSAGLAAGGSAFTLGAAASVAIGAIGVSLVLGGVSQLISPVPKVPQGAGSDSDPRKTYNFSGIQQSSRQGVPVPIVYGKTLCGSVVISAGIDTVQVKA